MPVVLAVGGELEPNVLLQAHYAADRLMLDARQLGRWDLAFLRSLSRLDQRVRPDQAADMVGAERRLHSLLHGSLVRLRRFPGHATGVKGWQCLHEVCQCKLRLRRLCAMSACAPRIWPTGRATARACSACSASTNRARHWPSAWTTASSASSSVPTAARASAFSAGKSPMRRRSTPSRRTWRGTRSA